MSVKVIGKHEKDARACRDALALTLNEMMAEDKSICYVDCDLMGCVNTKQRLAAWTRPSRPRPAMPTRSSFISSLLPFNLIAPK